MKAVEETRVVRPYGPDRQNSSIRQKAGALRLGGAPPSPGAGLGVGGYGSWLAMIETSSQGSMIEPIEPASVGSNDPSKRAGLLFRPPGMRAVVSRSWRTTRSTSTCRRKSAERS